MSRPPAALLLSLLVFAFASVPAGAQPSTTSVTLHVFGDGTTTITQVASASPNDTSISLQLLSSIIADPVVVDQNGSSLYFQVAGSNITVYTVGATGITLGYATTALTSKQGAVWTLDFTALFNTTVVLPQSATLTSVSGTPSQLSNSNGSPTVVVQPGKWEIDYGLPIEVPTASSTVSSSGPSTGSSSATTRASGASSNSLGPTSSAPNGASPSYVEPAALLAGGLIVAAVVSSVALKRRSAPLDPQTSQLRPDDVKVINFIAEKGGKVIEPEIRTHFALPKTSAWRQIKRLERMGYVKVTKIGSQNQIELVRKGDGQ